MHQGDPPVDVWCSSSLSPFSLISTNIGELPAEVKNNSVILCTLRIWNTGQKVSSSALQPLIDNKAFPPGIGKSIFTDWYSKDLKFVSYLFENGNFMSFEQTQNKYKLSRSHFFGFLQVGHFVKSYFTFPINQPILSSTERFLLHFNLTAFNGKKFISLFYEK